MPKFVHGCKRNQKEDSNTATSNTWVLKNNYIQLKTVLNHFVWHCTKVLDSAWDLAFIRT